MIKIRLIAIDPGSTKTNPTAYAIFDDGELMAYGSIEFKETGDYRLDRAYKEIKKIIKDKDIDAYTYEAQYGPSGKSIKTISHIIAMYRLAFYQEGIKFIGKHTPGHIKKIVTGNGRASKEEVQEAVKIMYKLSPTINKDECDAVAIGHTALTHYYTDKAI